MYCNLLIDVKPALSSMAEWLNSNDRDEFINIYSVVRNQCMTSSLGSLQDYSKTLSVGITSEHELQEKEIKTFNLILSGLQYLMDSGQFHKIQARKYNFKDIKNFLNPHLIQDFFTIDGLVHFDQA